MIWQSSRTCVISGVPADPMADGHWTAFFAAHPVSCSPEHVQALDDICQRHLRPSAIRFFQSARGHLPPTYVLIA